jgi:peptide deformylase
MATRKIVEWPNPSLKQKCEEVTEFDDALNTLLDDMRETMVMADGLGLAANQVAVAKRVFLMGIPAEDDAVERAEDETKDGAKDSAEDCAEFELFEVINPVIEGKRGEQRFEEGCLSFPGVSETVLRADEIDLAYTDRHGERKQRKLNGLAAVCAQHELDHLDGITFMDRLSPLKRRLAMRAYTRERRARLADQRDEATAALRR